MKRFLSVLLGVFLSVFWCTYLSNSSASALTSVISTDYNYYSGSVGRPYFNFGILQGEGLVNVNTSAGCDQGYASGKYSSTGVYSFGLYLYDSAACKRYFTIPAGAMIEINFRSFNLTFMKSIWTDNNNRFISVEYTGSHYADNYWTMTILNGGGTVNNGYIWINPVFYLPNAGDWGLEVLSWNIYTPKTLADYSGQLQNLQTGVGGIQSSVNNLINQSNQNSQAQIDAINNQTQAIDNLESSITDSDTTSSTDSAESFFSGFTTDTFGLTSIITAPLNLIQNITSSSCTDLAVPLPFVNDNISLPCLRGIYEDNFGAFYTMYQVITFGIIAYWVCVRIFNLVKDFKNPEHDEVEVLDL